MNTTTSSEPLSATPMDQPAEPALTKPLDIPLEFGGPLSGSSAGHADSALLAPSATSSSSLNINRAPHWLEVLVVLGLLFIAGIAAVLAYQFANGQKSEEATRAMATLARVKSADVQSRFELLEEASLGLGGYMQEPRLPPNFDGLARAVIARQPSALALGWLPVQAGSASVRLVNLQYSAQAALTPNSLR